ncbi:AIR synthase family protein [Halopenitus sp. POP-27]|uniref:AIR synthase family protein n=1 Tax=Halopenitus sp. POP-27 TaxID=2994425 RepID=UPI002468EF7C|nr:AIR synthase family protein [Halopenitus sp. POP-27]
MPTDGKISEAFFRRRIAPQLGADREDVRLGPKHGCDFGVIRGSEEETATVLATDPISILPDLGFERAGRFALHIVLSDVAVSGIAPSHLSIAFSLPGEMTDEAFDGVWTAIHEECTDLGIAVTTGHTARYPGSTFPWVGAATAIGRGDPDRIVRPDGARPGDRIVVTKGPAVEATGLFASLYPEALDGLSAETVATAQRRLDDVRLVEDAIAIADHEGVHAMHDATEGGLLGAFHELASAGDVRLRVDADHVPWQPGVEETCAALGMDPWRATTAGTLLAAVSPSVADEVVAALQDRGTPAAVVGEVRRDADGSGDDGNARVVIDGEKTSPPDGDSSWPVYARLSGSGTE